jgi:hypothetical protein
LPRPYRLFKEPELRPFKGLPLRFYKIKMEMVYGETLHYETLHPMSFPKRNSQILLTGKYPYKN